MHVTLKHLEFEEFLSEGEICSFFFSLIVRNVLLCFLLVRFIPPASCSHVKLSYLAAGDSH